MMMVGSESKKVGKDQESIQSSTTPAADPGYQWESDKRSSPFRANPGSAPDFGSVKCI